MMISVLRPVRKIKFGNQVDKFSFCLDTLEYLELYIVLSFGRAGGWLETNAIFSNSIFKRAKAVSQENAVQYSIVKVTMENLSLSRSFRFSKPIPPLLLLLLANQITSTTTNCNFLIAFKRILYHLLRMYHLEI